MLKINVLVDNMVKQEWAFVFIEGYLLEQYNQFKQFQKKMSFYYFYNTGASTLAANDQAQPFFHNFTPIYQNNFDALNTSYYAWNMPHCQLYSQNEVMMPMLNPIAVEEVQSPIVTSVEVLPKKRRAEKTLEKEIISAKKNSQSNLINQFYSFFGSREKSEKIVEKCCLVLKKTPEDSEKILNLFYTAIRFINAKRGRKYVNGAMLLKFFTPEEFGSYLEDLRDKINECSFINLNQLCQIFRRCTTYFLKNVSVSAILTSKRISIISKEEHLKKRRKIVRIVLEN